MSRPQQTPLEKLLADKQRLQQACSDKEKKIGQSFVYIQENAGTLFLSGLSSLLFPAKTGSKAGKSAVPVKASTASANGTATTGALNLSDFMSMGKALLPVAWEVIQPIIVSWSIRTAKKKIIGLFKSGKKKSEVKA